MSLFAELKRRNVIRMAGVYLVGAWLIVQIAGTVFPMFGAPEWLPRSIVVLLALGFVPALVFSWVYELTPEGLKRDADVPLEQSIGAQTGRRMDRLIIIGLVAVAALVVIDRFWPAPGRSNATNVAQSTTATPESGASTHDAAQAAQHSIAVLAFTDLSPGRDQEYFADGVAEEILNALTHVPGLKVAGRTSSFKFKNVNEDLRVIAQQLGVANILEGSVRKQGDRVRVTAQLVKAADGFHLWSDTYDRKIDDVFAIQDEISRAIVDALSIQLSDVGPKRREGSTVPEAHDLYLRARQLFARRNGAEIIRAAKLFDAATIIDPDFDAAYSGRARALSTAWWYTSAAAFDATLAEAKQAAEKALALNASSAEAHSVLSVVQLLYSWNWEEGLRETQLAIELGPNDAEIANFAGDTFRALADFDNAMKWEQRAVELDPLLPVNHADVGSVLLEARRCDEALAPSEKSLELDPNLAAIFPVLGRAYICLGEPAKAREAAEHYARLEPDLSYQITLHALVAISANEPDAARLAVAELERRADAGAVLHYDIAQIHALLGDAAVAAEWLERAYEARDPALVYDTRFLLPEDWPEYPAILAALDKPELNALFDIRRRNLAEHPRASNP